MITARPTEFAAMLAALTRHRGVLGSMIVDAEQAIVIDASLQHGVAGDAVAALAASLYRKARSSAAAAGLGAVAFLRLEGERGNICVLGAGEMVLVTIAESRTNVGLLRAEMRRAAEALA